MLALMMGKPDAIVTRTERVETLVAVDGSGKAIASFDGVGITFLAKRYGFNKNTSACRYWLKTIGVSEEQWIVEPTLVKSQKLSRDLLPWLDRQHAAKEGVRQRLIGE
jgi:anti-repressor protein